MSIVEKGLSPKPIFQFLGRLPEIGILRFASQCSLPFVSKCTFRLRHTDPQTSRLLVRRFLQWCEKCIPSSRPSEYDRYGKYHEANQCAIP